MPNLYAEFRKILAPSQQQVGEVVAYEDGTATIQLPGGDRCRAKGQTQLGAKVFIQDGKIIGPAPDLPVTVSVI